MRFVSLFLCAAGLYAAVPSNQPALQVLKAAPVRFEPNRGQMRQEIRWASRGLGYNFLFDDRETWIELGDHAVKLTFEGAERHGSFAGEDRLSHGANYFLATVRTCVPEFLRLRRSDVYPGIDVVYYGSNGELEYDFIVRPGADPSRIRMRFQGASNIRIDEHGALELTVGGRELMQRAPEVYQRTGDEILAVESHYRIERNGVVSVAVAHYDASRPLIIDPSIEFNTYLAGGDQDLVAAVAQDGLGNYYFAGSTESTSFPMFGNNYNMVNTGLQDAWFVEINPLLPGVNALENSSYFGGTGNDTLNALAVDNQGNVYLAGATNSADLPTSSGAFATTLAGTYNGFVAMINVNINGTGALIYATYLGGAGTDSITGVAVQNGLIYVAGFTNSSNFPATELYNTIAGSNDAFAGEIDPTQNGTPSLVAATYLGGSFDDEATAIALDPSGYVYVTGFTYSFDFPTTPNAFSTGYSGAGDVFIAKIDLTNGILDYSTFFGGNNIDIANAMLLDPSGHIAIAGYTLSDPFVITPNAMQPDFGGMCNAFLSIFDITQAPPQQLLYSTYYGGSVGEVAYALALDPAGNYYLGGYTVSYNLPVTSNALNPVSIGGSIDGFLAVINPGVPGPAGLLYGSYITGPGITTVYGISIDPSGTIYLTGNTTSNIFPANLSEAPQIGQSQVFIFGLQGLNLFTPATTEILQEDKDHPPLELHPGKPTARSGSSTPPNI